MTRKPSNTEIGQIHTFKESLKLFRDHQQKIFRDCTFPQEHTDHRTKNLGEKLTYGSREEAGDPEGVVSGYFTGKVTRQLRNEQKGVLAP